MLDIGFSMVYNYFRNRGSDSKRIMRLWRNRQTRTFEGRMGDRMGSSPINRTTECPQNFFWRTLFLFD